MGVPKFFGWIKKSFEEDVIYYEDPKYDNNRKSFGLYLDMNSIVHEVAQFVYGYGREEYKKTPEEIEKLKKVNLERFFFQKIGEYMLNLIELTGPKHIFMVAFDGPVPKAKMVQQRNRRFGSEKEVSNAFGWSNTQISPGTPFMDRLSEWFKVWFVKNKRVLPKRVIYSSHRVFGEGEHKILNHIRNNSLVTSSSFLEMKDRESLGHIIYSPDADMVILSIAMNKKIFITRRDHVDQSLLLVDIDSIRNKIIKKMRSIDVKDFIILTLFLGNDFLHTMPSMYYRTDHSMDVMFEVNRTLKNRHKNFSLTYKGKIRWNDFSLFIKELEKRSSKLFKFHEIENERAIERSKNIDEATYTRLARGKRVTIKNIMLDNNTKNKEIVVNPEIYRFHYHKKIFGSYDRNFSSDIKRNNIKQMCQNWMEGCAWVLKYYTQGIGNRNWFYRFHYSPMLRDLSEFVGTGLENRYKNIDNMMNDKGHEWTIFEQLISIMPRWLLHYLPEQVKVMALEEIPEAYPEHVQKDIKGKRQEYMGISLVPFISASKVMRVFEELELSAELEHRNRFEEEIIYSHR
jgi:5'-3' exonuclease